MEGDVLYVEIFVWDPDGDDLKFNIEEGPDGAVILPNGTFKWATKRGDAGTYEIWITVTDGMFIEDISFEVVVRPDDTSRGGTEGFMMWIYSTYILSALIISLGLGYGAYEDYFRRRPS